MPTNLSKAELATILSALDGQTRNPANRDKALAAIGKRAIGLGLTTDAILEAAPGLLDGRLSPADWLAEITEGERATAGTAEVVTTVKADVEAEVEKQQDAAEPAASAQAPKAQPRDGTKQATLIALLRRKDGADLDEIAEATGWQKHTIRGAISGALKKKLGLEVTSTRDQQGRRIYRIA
jgi:hypothetical protein